MSLTKDEILEGIAKMPVMDLVDLIKAAEEKFDVSAQAAVAVAAPVAGDAGAGAAEKTEFDVVLDSFGDNKVAVIKAVRGATSLALKEAKELVEKAPSPIKEAIAKDEAEKLKADLEKAGAKVTIK